MESIVTTFRQKPDIFANFKRIPKRFLPLQFLLKIEKQGSLPALHLLPRSIRRLFLLASDGFI